MADEEKQSFVSIDPGRRFGQPCIGGTRLAVMDIAKPWWSHEGPWSTWEGMQQQWPTLTRTGLLVAAWYLGTYGSREWRRRWGTWAKEHHAALWGERYSDMPLPPHKETP